MEGLRRSKRQATICYDSNGRDFVASELNLTRTQLELWLALPTVHPYLHTWYNLCILGRKRFRDGRDWIETGEEGYFYGKGGLEEDLLLMCLGTGNAEDIEEVAGGFLDYGTLTGSWLTQELWARTVWRIVQSNRGLGRAFEKKVMEHPAAAYGIVIDILTIAFHSIAHRGGDSIWHNLIMNGDQAQSLSSLPTMMPTDPLAGQEIQLDQTPGDTDEDQISEEESIADSDTSMLDSDEDFEDPHTPQKAARDILPQTPKAPKKLKAQHSAADALRGWLSTTGNDKDDSIVVNSRRSVGASLHLIDENGTPITGYRMAGEA